MPRHPVARRHAFQKRRWLGMRTGVRVEGRVVLRLVHAARRLYLPTFIGEN